MAASSPPVPALISRKISLVSFGSLSTNSFSKYPSRIIFLAVFIVYILFGNYSNYWIILLSSLVVLFSEAIYPIFYLQGNAVVVRIK